MKRVCRAFMKRRVKGNHNRGEKYERVVEKVLAMAGYATYTRPKVKYHSRDMFRGDVLFVYQGEVVVVQVKRYVSMRAGARAGRRALLETLRDGRSPRRYVAFVRSNSDVLVMATPDAREVAVAMCGLFGGGGVQVYCEQAGALRLLENLDVSLSAGALVVRPVSALYPPLNEATDDVVDDQDDDDDQETDHETDNETDENGEDTSDSDDGADGDGDGDGDGRADGDEESEWASKEGKGIGVTVGVSQKRRFFGSY